MPGDSGDSGVTLLRVRRAIDDSQRERDKRLGGLYIMTGFVRVHGLSVSGCMCMCLDFVVKRLQRAASSPVLFYVHGDRRDY